MSNVQTELFTTHGACSWIELYTTDKSASTTFYSELFNWNIKEMPMADGSLYSVINVSEMGVGGIVETPEAGENSGGWGIYITVNSVDEVLSKTENLGGKIVTPAFDAPGVGRMAKIADPTGAVLSVITYQQDS